MVYNLLDTALKTREIPLSEAFLYGILGFMVVIVGIAFLIFVVWAVGKFMSKDSPKSEKTTKTKVEEKEEVITPSLAVSDATEEITEEMIAVFTAAIMSYYQKNNPKCEFTVKRIKRI